MTQQPFAFKEKQNKQIKLQNQNNKGILKMNHQVSDSVNIVCSPNR